MTKNLFKKKILHRAKYRGIKELDIIFYNFLLEYENMLEQISSSLCFMIVVPAVR